MAANNEVDLIIRAKNLSTKTIKQLNTELGQIAENQAKVADSNKLAERSFESLKAEQNQLLAVMKSIDDRARKLGAFDRQRQEVDALQKELNEARGTLQTLAQQFYNTEKPTKEFTQQMSAANTNVSKLEIRLKAAEGRLSTTGAKLQEMGVDATKFSVAQEEINGSMQKALGLYKQAETNVERYDSALKEVRVQQDANRAAEVAAATAAKDTAKLADIAARERIEALQKEERFAQLTANVYRTLAREREAAAAAGSRFRASGAQAAADARGLSAPGIGSGAGLGGAAAGVQAVLAPAKAAVATLDALEKEVEQLNAEFAALTPEARQSAEGVAKLADQSRRLREASAALTSQASIADELNKTNAALQTSQARFTAARDDVIRYGEAVARADAPNQELADSLKRSQNELRNAHAELVKQTDAFNRVEQRARAMGITVEKLVGIEQRLASTARNVNTGQQQVAQTLTTLGNASDNAGRKMQAFNNSQRTALSLYQRSRGQVLSLVASYAGLFGAINLASGALDTAIDNEKILSRLTVANKGDVKAAADEFEYLKEKANELGLEFGPLATSYSRFAVAARDAGQSAEATRYIFEAFSEASAALRLSGDETEGAFKALEQIFSKGFIQAEELRGQLGDRLTGAFNLFAKAIGVTTSQLNDMLEKGGQVRAEFVLLAAQQARGMYGDQARAASDSLIGDLARMKNAFRDLKSELIQGGLGEELRKLFTDLTKFLKSDNGKQFAQNLITVFRSAAMGLQELVKWFAENQRIVKLVADITGFLARNVKTLLGLYVALEATKIIAFFVKLNAAMIAARGSTIAMNTAMSVGTVASARAAGTAISALIAGPIAALLAIAAAGIVIGIVIKAKTETDTRSAEASRRKSLDEYTRGIRESEKALVTLARTDAKTTQARVDSANQVLSALDKQKDAIREQIRLNTEARKKQVGSNPTNSREFGRELKQAKAAGLAVIEAEDKRLNAQLDTLLKRADSLRGVVASAEKDVARLQGAATGTGNAALDAELARVRAAADAAAAAAGKGKDKKGDKDAENEAKKLAADRIKLAEDTAAKLREIDDELVQAQDDSLSNRLKLVNSEFEVKKQEVLALIEEAKKLGLGDQVAQLEASLVKVEQTRALTVASTTKEFNSDQVAKNEQKINDILAQREMLVQANNELVEAGLRSTAEGQTIIEEATLRMIPNMQTLLAEAQAFINTLSGDEAIKAQASLDAIAAKVRVVGTEMSAQKRQVIDVFVQGFGNAFMQTATLISDVLKGVKDSGEAWEAFGDIVLNTIADILIQLAQMIIMQQIFNALKNASESGGTWGKIFGAIAGYLQHGGGVVGQGTKRRGNIPSYVFEAAPRYHSGGVAGMAPDEVGAVLKRNEEVLTEDDPRHRFNGGLNGQAQPNVELQVNNMIDSGSVVAAGNNTRAGRQSIFNVIKADRESFKKLLS